MPIRPLPDTLINQIAAGEVVERPASVVKELVENALDAGARRVDIDLEEGGIRLIRIRDDGCGIAAEELPLALSRHATSKIASLDDLEAVATLGFRGEALPSIASISRFSLSSRRATDAHGAVLRVDGGKAAAVAPAAHAIGTTVEVRDLFYNVPARRKFLRAPRTELGHIEEWLRSLALARPRIDLRLAVDGKPARRYRAEADNPGARVAEALGPEFFGQSLRIEHSASGLHLHGWIGAPPYSRALGDQQYLYVNGRAVRDRHLGHAAKSAYKEVLFHGRQPAYVLFLELDPLRVDVNVHPAKHEVRFRDARLIYDFVLGALREALADSRAQHAAAMAMPRDLHAHGGHALPALSPGRVEDTRAFYVALYGEASVSAGLPAPHPPRADESLPPLGHALAILHARYLLAQDARGLLAIDLHEAHRRASLLRLRTAHAGVGLSPQPLLLPLPLRVDGERAARAQAMVSRLAAVAVVLERTGDQEVQLRQVPALLIDADLPALIDALLALPEDAPEQALLQTLATHLPLPQRALTVAEMNAWLRDIERSDADAAGDAALVRRWTLNEMDGAGG
ncbi:DNA mismatch repair protein MutL [Pseudoxanthomonas indica]|uniref:DNA mismatch repair protein MutL n=1 Tax=Pseudoxanthomonas indica TaxID=428993 RepID=A0A1T5J0Y6_9GAMM|nr:DNA mismatch repair endonuclease MutL [Pseudoxanthomonas indica]GGD55540.1 DNA mismatch repair protein MutL [Pseudoxanthomonas indica]SKC45004.1 DNA mismatch repair protein MutL [Pseudoxanthomonas indica]